jgi:cell division protease FtsH
LLLRGARGLTQLEGEPLSRGLLLVGPSGVGKGALAERISAAAGAPLATVSAAGFRGSVIGADTLLIKSLYRRARRLARAYGSCVIYVDDLNTLSASGASGAEASGLAELLAQMAPSPQRASRWQRGLRAAGLPRVSHTNRENRVGSAPQLVLTIGATSALTALDPALLRPGRFDRSITLAPPSSAQRAEVIAQRLSHVRHDDLDDRTMSRLVADLAGYTPPEIQQIITEAVVIAHADGRDSIGYPDLVAARETRACGVVYPRTLSTLERRRLAYSAAGRAVAQACLTPRLRVTRVSMIQRSGQPGAGFVETQAMEEIVTQSADEVFASIEIALASRAAGELFLQARLDCAADDLANATQLALRYVAQWGMGDSLFSASLTPERLYADPALGAQAEALLRRAYDAARALLEQRSKAVIAVAEALLERADLDGDEFAQALRQAETPSHAEMTALASVAEATLFGSSATIDFQAPASHLVGPVAPGATANRARMNGNGRNGASAPAQTAPRPLSADAPPAFAASPSQELRADRVIDRAILRAPLRQTILRKTDPNLPAVTSANGANGANGAAGTGGD